MTLPISPSDKEEYDRCLLLFNKLTQLKKYKSDNPLEFYTWDRYPEQNKARLAILNRMRTRIGPTIHVVIGGNRSGKSELGGGVTAELFDELENARIWCATISDLSVKVQQRKLASLIPKRCVSYGDYDFVRGWKNNTIVSKKNTVVYLKTYEQGAGSFQGDDIDFAWFDEECPYDVFNETLIRLIDRQGCMVITFTSLMGFTALVNKLWESNDPDVVNTLLTPQMNPYLSNKAKLQLKSAIDPDEVASRWDGKPHMKQGLIYKNYGDAHKVNRFDYVKLYKSDPNRYLIHEGIDPHVRTPHHWLRFFYDKELDILYVVEELKAPKESMEINDYAELIHAMRAGVKPDLTQIDTSSMAPQLGSTSKDIEETQQDNNNIRNMFSKSGINTVLVEKDNAIGLNQVKVRLKNDKLNHPHLFVFNDLSGVHWEFARYSWASYASAGIADRKEMINTPSKKNDHFMDIIKYECILLISNAFRQKPQTYTAYEEQYTGTGY